MKGTVIRKLEARAFLEGSEFCREYLRNEQMWFGTSTLQPGQTGALDSGHAQSWEVFYCAAGHAVVDDGEFCHELIEGDAFLIPPLLPHTITNIGAETVVIVWAGAPGESREESPEDKPAARNVGDHNARPQ